MRIVAVTNIKGGVGKTTTAVNLAYLVARTGHPTLLWDLDPQAAATWTLRGVAGAQASAKKLVNGKRELPELIVPTGYPHFDLLPADFSYRNFDLHLNERKHPTERLLRMSAALGERYDYLFLDCPPGISLLSENVLRAADAAILPVVPSPLSVRMLGALRDFVAGEGWTDLVLLPFLSMVDRRRALHVELTAEARARFPGMLATEIPYWSEIERMSVRREPLPAYSPHSAASALYEALLDEVLVRIGATRSAPAGASKGHVALTAGARESDPVPRHARPEERSG